MGPRKTERKKKGGPPRGDSPAQLSLLCRQIQMKILGKLEGCFCGMQMYMM